MAKNTTYRVDVHRDGRWWLLVIPELDTVGQARTLPEAAYEARCIIAAWFGIENEEEVTIDLRVDLPQDVRDTWDVGAAHDAAARKMAAQAAQERRAAVKALTDSGISKADAARALGISRQRVSQLTGVT